MLEPRNPPLGPLQLFQGSRKPSLGECSSTSCLCLLSQNCVGQGHHRHLPWEGDPRFQPSHGGLACNGPPNWWDSG